MGMTTGSASRTSRDEVVEMSIVWFGVGGGEVTVSKFSHCSFFLFVFLLESLVKFCFGVMHRLEFHNSIQSLCFRFDSTGFHFFNESTYTRSTFGKHISVSR